MKKMKILAIVGSLRKESFNRQLAFGMQKIIGDKAEFELLDYSDIPYMNQDIEYPAPEAVKRVREKVKAAYGIWFFTPEYNHFFSGVMKNLLDWLSRPVSETEPRVVKGKPAAISGISPGMSGTLIAQDHLVTLISFLGMEVMNAPRITIPNALDMADEEGQLDLSGNKSRMEEQAEAFMEFIEKRS